MSKDFADQMGRFIDSYMNRFDLLVRDVTENLFTFIVLRTPVDTGRTRGNYFVSVSGAMMTDYDEMNFDPTGTNSISQASDAIKGIKAGGVVRIINNTPYVMDLEFGSSKQAPRGMARLTVTEFQPIVNRAVEKVANAR